MVWQQHISSKHIKMMTLFEFYHLIYYVLLVQCSFNWHVQSNWSEWTPYTHMHFELVSMESGIFENEYHSSINVNAMRLIIIFAAKRDMGFRWEIFSHYLEVMIGRAAAENVPMDVSSRNGLMWFFKTYGNPFIHYFRFVLSKICDDFFFWLLKHYTKANRNQSHSHSFTEFLNWIKKIVMTMKKCDMCTTYPAAFIKLMSTETQKNVCDVEACFRNSCCVWVNFQHFSFVLVHISIPFLRQRPWLFRTFKGKAIACFSAFIRIITQLMRVYWSHCLNIFAQCLCMYLYECSTCRMTM